MTVLRMQVSVWQDSLAPRDAINITPHFEMTGALQDADALCESLADAIAGYYAGEGQIRVRSYDAEGTPPVYPNGEAIRNLGLAPASTVNREVAICLSYYAGQNRPRQRGRLYIPCSLIGQAPSSPRPSAAAISSVAALVPILAGLGGVDVDWVVWSRVDQEARKVTNWWVDDTWDTQRRRGLAATTRTTGTTSG